jgi:hypothetical protein
MTMQVTIKTVPQEVLVQTITVSPNIQDPSNMFLFFCFRCGFQLVQIQGKVSRIFPGLEPTDTIPVVNQCSRCREKYVFLSKKLSAKKTRLVLSHSNFWSDTAGRSIFRCFICRTPLLAYNSTQAVDLVTHKVLSLPASIDCTNIHCSQKYVIEDIL